MSTSSWIRTIFDDKTFSNDPSLVDCSSCTTYYPSGYGQGKTPLTKHSCGADTGDTRDCCKFWPLLGQCGVFAGGVPQRYYDECSDCEPPKEPAQVAPTDAPTVTSTIADSTTMPMCSQEKASGAEISFLSTVFVGAVIGVVNAVLLWNGIMA